MNRPKRLIKRFILTEAYFNEGYNSHFQAENRTDIHSGYEIDGRPNEFYIQSNNKRKRYDWFVNGRHLVEVKNRPTIIFVEREDKRKEEPQAQNKQ